MTAINKKSNEYAEVISEIYDRIPKAVLAAIAVSFSLILNEGQDFDQVQDTILTEWRILNENGIVPQKPIKS
jgi:hypothetical protein